MISQSANQLWVYSDKHFDWISPWAYVHRKRNTFHACTDGPYMKDYSPRSITYSVLISYCFALHPYEKRELIKPGWVIAIKLHKRLGQNTFQ